MKIKCVLWLYDELPDLVSQGVLSAADAARLRDHYGPLGDRARRNYGLIVCGILGAALIGLGIILLFAHNWEDLPRSVRTVLAFTPLAAAQVLTGWVLVRRSDSVAWREGSTTFLTMTIASAIALIGQTYHMPGDLDTFLLTWMLLTVPLVYIARATMPALLYWVGLTCWAGCAQYQGSHVVLFWPLAAVVAPYLWKSVKEKPHGPRALLLEWVFILCLCVATGITLEKCMPGLWIVVYCSLFATLYLLDTHVSGGASALWQRPFRAVGAAGVAVLSLVLTFELGWESIGWHHYRRAARFHEWAAVQDYVIAIGLLAASVALLAICVRKKEYAKVPFGLAGLVALAGYAAVAGMAPVAFGIVLFNVYLFILGAGVLIAGIRRGRLTTVNAGLLIPDLAHRRAFLGLESLIHPSGNRLHHHWRRIPRNQPLAAP